jgi:hypothetical protein
MRNITLCIFALVLASLVSGCGMAYKGPMADMAPTGPSGLIYTHTYQPLTVDMHQTKVVDTEKSGNIKHISLNWASVAWDSAGIGDIAKKNGMNELYFADLETFSILRVWNQYTVHVYGK